MHTYVCTYVLALQFSYLMNVRIYGPFSTNVQLENGCAYIRTCIGMGVVHLLFVLHMQ